MAALATASRSAAPRVRRSGRRPRWRGRRGEDRRDRRDAEPCQGPTSHDLRHPGRPVGEDGSLSGPARPYPASGAGAHRYRRHAAARRPEAHTAALAAPRRTCTGCRGRTEDVRAIGPAGRTDREIARLVLRPAGSPTRRSPRGSTAWVARASAHLPGAGAVLRPPAPRAGAAQALARLAAAGAALALLTGNLEPIAHAKMAAAGLGRWFPAGQGAFGSDHDRRDALVPIAVARQGGAADVGRGGRHAPRHRLRPRGRRPLRRGDHRPLRRGGARGTPTPWWAACRRRRRSSAAGLRARPRAPPRRRPRPRSPCAAAAAYGPHRRRSCRPPAARRSPPARGSQVVGRRRRRSRRALPRRRRGRRSRSRGRSSGADAAALRHDRQPVGGLAPGAVAAAPRRRTRASTSSATSAATAALKSRGGDDDHPRCEPHRPHWTSCRASPRRPRAGASRATPGASPPGASAAGPPATSAAATAPAARSSPAHASAS